MQLSNQKILHEFAEEQDPATTTAELKTENERMKNEIIDLKSKLSKMKKSDAPEIESETVSQLAKLNTEFEATKAQLEKLNVEYEEEKGENETKIKKLVLLE